jgi:hypothetical protein
MLDHPRSRRTHHRTAPPGEAERHSHGSLSFARGSRPWRFSLRHSLELALKRSHRGGECARPGAKAIRGTAVGSVVVAQ